MAKALFVREASLERLRQNTGANAKRYENNAPWLADYFKNEPWYLQSKIDIPESLDLVVPNTEADLFDLENTKVVYDSLRHLTPLQAADERLWAYLTHVSCWTYMRKRWPVERYKNKRLAENIQERYLFDSDRSRALIRNGMARLWWYGYATYDDRRKNPFELTAVLLKNLDVTQSILERTFSKNRAVTQALLSVLLQRENEGAPFYERDRVRDLAKYIVQIGGVTIVDALSEEDVTGLVLAKVEELSSTTTED